MTRHPIPLLLLALALPAAAAAPVAPPEEDALPELAIQLADHLRGRTVTAPGGDVVTVVADSGEPPSRALLDTVRLEACVRTVSEADAWPSAWLVVQVEAEEFDLVLPVRLDDDGRIENPEPVFAAERREWTVDTLREAIRSATGRKPGGGFLAARPGWPGSKMKLRTVKERAGARK